MQVGAERTATVAVVDNVVEERERARKLALSPESEVKLRMHHAMLCRLVMLIRKVRDWAGDKALDKRSPVNPLDTGRVVGNDACVRKTCRPSEQPRVGPGSTARDTLEHQQWFLRLQYSNMSEMN